MRLMRLVCRLCLLCLALGAACASAASDLRAALEDPQRPAEQRALDALRKPAELIEFAGLRPGDRVADYMAGNAYFTRIFSRVVGELGRVYAFLPSEQLEHCAPDEVAGALAVKSDPHYPNVRLLVTPGAAFKAPEPLDAIWLVQGYHDLHVAFMAPTDVATVNRALFAALRPGGVLIVIDHVAAAGAGPAEIERLHRIDPAQVRRELEAAGFTLEAESALLRNPADAHTLRIFDPAIRHHTDQMVLRFRKPAGQARRGPVRYGWLCA